mmetsp:Transcript_47771/g.104006  ORF Transcript_47771/g.104006 Transcript_47771/m.104006 type:complete len:214 (-) Transcript_47771:1334-1975(-)
MGCTSLAESCAARRMCHSLSICLPSSPMSRAKMSLTRGSSTWLSSSPDRTASSRCSISNATFSKIGRMERSTSSCPASGTACRTPGGEVLVKCAATTSIQTARRLPLLSDLHHSMIAARIFLAVCLSLKLSTPLAKVGTSLRTRTDQLSRISRERFSSRSAIAQRTRRYSCRNTVRLRCSPSSPTPEVCRPVSSVISRATCKKHLLTVMACLR